MKKLFYGVAGLIVLAGVFLVSLPTILHKAGLHPEYHGPTVALPGKRA
ncbi:MAG: type 1 glutamine amidotransferase domain-containing protein, partial [Haliea sp.]|nr:type 1 glutamine amidotransferase domain-containing protein [Haliea sp.]